MTGAPIHLRPTAELAERVLLPGDPGRALQLAQTVLERPRMFNHTRGLWGYSGAALCDGAPLTIQSTGMGGPSAAIVIEELIALGAQRFIRVGTCGALSAELGLGDLVVARAALAADGTSAALTAAGEVSGGAIWSGPRLLAADPGLSAALASAAGNRASVGIVASCDLFYDPDPARAAGWRAAGALAVEMETATLLALAGRHGVTAASLLAVSDVLVGGRTRIDDDGLLVAGKRLGDVATRALADL
ncbi:MAG: purine-nucleoside phosphorylase [Solirubrobacterales bacterium]|nr:MAG: purine-nucleoside phosphorylase [Solirubrobacterales bacterium]